MSSGGRWRILAATSRRNPTNPDKIRTQPAKKYRKILPKSDTGGSPEPPESVRDPSGMRPSEENAKKRFPAAKKSNVTWLRDRFLAIFGSRPGAQNRQKTRPEAKKCVRRRRRKRFLSFFLAVAVRSRSPDRFLEGPTLKMWPDHHTELDFKEIAFFEKNAVNRPSGDPFWRQN